MKKRKGYKGWLRLLEDNDELVTQSCVVVPGIRPHPSEQGFSGEIPEEDADGSD